MVNIPNKEPTTYHVGGGGRKRRNRKWRTERRMTMKEGGADNVILFPVDSRERYETILKATPGEMSSEYAKMFSEEGKAKDDTRLLTHSIPTAHAPLTYLHMQANDLESGHSQIGLGRTSIVEAHLPRARAAARAARMTLCNAGKLASSPSRARHAWLRLRCVAKHCHLRTDLPPLPCLHGKWRRMTYH